MEEKYRLIIVNIIGGTTIEEGTKEEMLAYVRRMGFGEDRDKFLLAGEKVWPNAACYVRLQAWNH